MSFFQDYFEDFGTFRLVCFLLAVVTLLLLTFTWPALANSLGSNAPAVYYTVGAMVGVIVLGFAGATIPFLLARRNGGYDKL